MARIYFYIVFCSVSLAKYAVAFFITSRSSRTCFNSLRNRVISASRSETDLPPSISLPCVLAADVQFDRVLLGMASLSAANSSVSPYSKTNLTASLRNSDV